MKKILMALLIAMMLTTTVYASSHLPKIKVVRDYKADKAILNRKGNILITWNTGTVLDNKGNGKADGFKKGHNYISYRKVKGVKKGDRVFTMFIWNPDNNYCDDIIYRYDMVL